MRLVVPTSAQVAYINGPAVIPCRPVIHTVFGRPRSCACQSCKTHVECTCGHEYLGTSYFEAIALPFEQLCRNCKPWASRQPVCTILPSIGQGSQVRPQASDLQIHAKVAAHAACKLAGCPASRCIAWPLRAQEIDRYLGRKCLGVTLRSQDIGVRAASVWATALFASDKISVNRLQAVDGRVHGVRMQACRCRVGQWSTRAYIT